MRAAKFLHTPAAPAMPEKFRQLAVLEPQLLDLWDDAIHYAAYWERRPNERARGQQTSWREIRFGLVVLVGPGREDGDDILGSIPAYECAVRALRAALGMEC